MKLLTSSLPFMEETSRARKEEVSRVLLLAEVLRPVRLKTALIYCSESSLFGGERRKVKGGRRGARDHLKFFGLSPNSLRKEVRRGRKGRDNGGGKGDAGSPLSGKKPEISSPHLKKKGGKR